MSFWTDSGCVHDPSAPTREELRAAGSFRYADGSRMERGDEVSAPGGIEGRIGGFVPTNWLVVVLAPGRGAVRVPAGEIERRRR